MAIDKQELLWKLRNPPVMSMVASKDHLYVQMAIIMEKAAEYIEKEDKNG